MGFVANDTVIGETVAEAHVLARSWHLWAGLCAAALVAALTGPFGTYETMSLPARMAYWGGVVITSYWMGLLVSFATAIWVENRGVGAPWSTAAGALAAACPVALWVSLLHVAILSAPFAAEVLRLLPYIATISLIVTFLSEAMDARDVASPNPPEARSEPRWLDRLPPELGRDLRVLQAQDHYLRAETALGETLLRGSIGDAADALGTYGLRVHRSWWVARRAIKAYRTRRGARFVVLSTGAEIPVGRSYARLVRDYVERIDADPPTGPTPQGR